MPSLVTTKSRRQWIISRMATVVALDGNALVTVVGDLALKTAPDLTRVLDTFIE
jgi:hypothetical protein